MVKERAHEKKKKRGSQKTESPQTEPTREANKQQAAQLQQPKRGNVTKVSPQEKSHRNNDPQVRTHAQQRSHKKEPIKETHQSDNSPRSMPSERKPQKTRDQVPTNKPHRKYCSQEKAHDHKRKKRHKKETAEEKPHRGNPQKRAYAHKKDQPEGGYKGGKADREKPTRSRAGRSPQENAHKGWEARQRGAPQ